MSNRITEIGGAVAVAGPPGQVGPFHGGAGAGALHRRRVHDPYRVVPQVGVGREHPDQPFVVAGLPRAGRETRRAAPGARTAASGLLSGPRATPGHGQGEQLGIRQLRRPAPSGAGTQVVVDQPGDRRDRGARGRRHDDHCSADPHRAVLAPAHDLGQPLALLIGEPARSDRFCHPQTPTPRPGLTSTPRVITTTEARDAARLVANPVNVRGQRTRPHRVPTPSALGAPAARRGPI
jgi:hypothetical protein